MSRSEHTLQVLNTEITVIVESPLDARSPSDDFREVTVSLPDGLVYRGVFVLDMSGNKQEAPVSWDDNQLQRVASLETESILGAVAYLLENHLENSALELISAESSLEAEEKSNDKSSPVTIDMQEVEERLFKNLRHTVELLRATGLASSREEVLDYVRKQTEEIVDYFDGRNQS